MTLNEQADSKAANLCHATQNQGQTYPSEDNLNQNNYASSREEVMVSNPDIQQQQRQQQQQHVEAQAGSRNQNYDQGKIYYAQNMPKKARPHYQGGVPSQQRVKDIETAINTEFGCFFCLVYSQLITCIIALLLLLLTQSSNQYDGNSMFL